MSRQLAYAKGKAARRGGRQPHADPFTEGGGGADDIDYEAMADAERHADEERRGGAHAGHTGGGQGGRSGGMFRTPSSSQATASPDESAFIASTISLPVSGEQHAHACMQAIDDRHI